MKRVLLLFAFTALYFLVRIPLLSHPIIGEEGLHANMFYHQPKDRKYALIARINGQEILTHNQHPALLFEPINRMGALASRLVDLPALSDDALIRLMRFSFGLFQWLIWMMFLVAFTGSRYTESRDMGPFLLFIAGCLLFPIGVGSSITLTADGSIGAVMCGLLAFSIFLADTESIRGRWSVIFLFGSGICFGFGKQIWSVIFLIAALMTLVLARLIGKLDRRLMIFLSAGVAGCLVGNWLSYRFDPESYRGSLSLLVRILEHDHQAKLSETSGGWPMTLEKLSMTFTMIALFFFSLAQIWKEKRALPVLIWLLSAGLFGAFFISSWSPAYRYYVPALCFLCPACLMVFPPRPGKAVRIFVLLFLLANAVHLFLFTHSHVGRHLSVTLHQKNHNPTYFAFYQEKIAFSRGYTCIPILPVGMAYRDPKQDFVINTLGEEGANQYAKKYNFTVCP